MPPVPKAKIVESILEWPPEEQFDGTDTERFVHLYEHFTQGLTDRERVQLFPRVCKPIVLGLIHCLQINLMDWAAVKDNILRMFPPHHCQTIEDLYYECVDYYQEFSSTLAEVGLGRESCRAKKERLYGLVDHLCYDSFETVRHTNLVPAKQIIILFLHFQTKRYVEYFQYKNPQLVKYLEGALNWTRPQALRKFRLAVRGVPQIFYCKPSAAFLIKDMVTEGGDGIFKILQDELPQEYKLVTNALKYQIDKVPLRRLWKCFIKVADPCVEKIPSMILLVIYQFYEICPIYIVDSLLFITPFFKDYGEVIMDIAQLKQTWNLWKIVMENQISFHLSESSIKAVFKKHNRDMGPMNVLFDGYRLYSQRELTNSSSFSFGLHTFIPCYTSLTKNLIKQGVLSVRDRYMAMMYLIPVPARYKIMQTQRGLISYLKEEVPYEKSDSSMNPYTDPVGKEEYFEKTIRRWQRFVHNHNVTKRAWRRIRKDIKQGIMDHHFPVDVEESENPADLSDTLPGVAKLPATSLECMFCGLPDHDTTECESLEDFEKADMLTLEGGVFKMRYEAGSIPPVQYPQGGESFLESKGFRNWAKTSWSIYDWAPEKVVESITDEKLQMYDLYQ